jgi:homoserine dehydrogenase
MKKLRIGLVGLGNVGRGVCAILEKDAAILQSKTQTIFEIVAVSARSKKNFIDPKIKFYHNCIDLAKDPEVEVVVEVMGGDKIAKELFAVSLKNGKQFVTANKALMAEHGFELAQLAEKLKSHVGFEAAVAGSTPIIKIFKEGFTGNEITEFYAILNGTCNFILTKMAEGLDFTAALHEAQKSGYAEADPTFDVKGIDTAHKLAILAAIASATKPAFAAIKIEGIDEILTEDIRLAGALGYKIKLLAIYKNLGQSMQQAVYPALVKVSEKIARIDGPFNAVLTNASNAGLNLIVGSGAGSLPTASAIVADLADIAMGRQSFMFGSRSSDLTEARICNISQREGQYFIRLAVDRALSQKINLAAVIFGQKIKIEKSTFIDNKTEILCGFLTEKQKESDIIEIFKSLDCNSQDFDEKFRLVKAAKFLRVEATNF